MPTVDIYNLAVHLVLDVNTICYEITVGIIGAIMIFLLRGEPVLQGSSQKICLHTYT
jgi:hypothetical protein